MRLRIQIITLTLCAFAGLDPARAQNLITNPTFANNIAGWSVNILATHSITWDTKDARDSASSGSLRVHNLAPASPNVVFSDCFAVAPGDTLAFGAAISADSGTSSARVALWIYQDAICAGSNVATNASLRTNFPLTGWGASQGTTVAPGGAVAARLVLSLLTNGTLPSAVYFDNVFVSKGETCVGTETVACLNKDRFRLSATWEKRDGTRGWARVVELTDDSAYLWFFQPTNIEMVAKVLDACSFSPNFWVFAAGLTNVKTDVVIFDTLTGESWTHNNPQGEAFAPVQDTGAFATCEP